MNLLSLIHRQLVNVFPNKKWRFGLHTSPGDVLVLDIEVDRCWHINRFIPKAQHENLDNRQIVTIVTIMASDLKRKMGTPSPKPAVDHTYDNDQDAN